MNKGDKAEKRIIKDSLFPISLFAIYLGVLLLMSGIHQLSFRHLSGRSAADVRNPSGIGGADEYS